MGLLAFGVLAGFLSSLLGIGGGIVMVPVLHYVLKFEWHEAAALSLVAIAAQSPTGILQHRRRGAVKAAVAIPLAVGGVAGVYVGALLEPRITVPWLKFTFALLMLLAALRMVRPALHERFHTQNVVVLLLLGVAAGVASKLLGIGGGLVTVPVLTLLGTPIHVAVGSSLVPVFTNAAVASAVNIWQGLQWTPAVPMAVGGLLGVPLGARSAHALPAARLKQVFAAGLTLAAIYVGATSGAF